MSDDYKYDIMELCRERALEKYGKEYEELSDEQQLELFQRVEEDYWSDKIDYAYERYSEGEMNANQQ